MGTVKSLMGISLVISLLLCTSSCFDDTNYAKDANELITAAGHFDEPKEYEPTQQGNPIVTTETDNQGITYSVTTTSYKRAKRIENYKSLSSFKIGEHNVKSTNDIYLGSIIQGKYWFNDGDLISIGDYSRKPITITFKDIILSNGNSAIIENPSNANVTSAINTLLSSGNSAVSTDYSFIKSEAYSKDQVGLELGFKPKWLGDLFSLNLSFENSYETNTVIIYFKQRYYSIEVDLPASPGDFFGDNINLESLRNKINPTNPPGYISSIDYGRTIIAKVTSSYSASQMAASVDAAFQALSVNIGGQYQEILENSYFECKVYGGIAGSVTNDAQSVIDLINSGMTPTSIADALPIAYHVNYLDGSVFRIGHEVEYTTKEYEQITESVDFDVQIYGFYVYNDCDWISDGDFSYTIDVNGFEYSQDNITCGDDDFIWIGATKSLSLPNIAGQKIIISGTLYEDEDLVKSFSKDFYHPWNESDLTNAIWYINGSNTDVWEEYLKRSDNCDAMFLCRVEEK